MTTLTIKIPVKVEKTLSELVTQLGGKVIDTSAGSKKSVKDKTDVKTLTKKEKQFLKGFDEAIEFVNLHKQGKVEAKPIELLLSEI